jgi:hypothetical protein
MLDGRSRKKDGSMGWELRVNLRHERCREEEWKEERKMGKAEDSEVVLLKGKVK